MLFQPKHLSVVEKPISVFSRSAYLLPVFLLLGCDALNPWRTLHNTIERSEFHPITSVCLSSKAREIKLADDKRSIDDLVLISVANGLTFTLSQSPDGSYRIGETELRCVMNFLRHETSISIRSNPLVKQEHCSNTLESRAQLRCVDRIVVRSESIQSRRVYGDMTIEMALEFSPQRLEKGSITTSTLNQAGIKWGPPTFLELIP
jgi:hypothetical protein